MRCNFCMQTKDASQFYASNGTKCKECLKAAVRLNRLANAEHYRSFDRQRASRPDRVAARAAYQRTPEGRLAHARAVGKWQVSNAIRRAANIAVGNAVRAGKLAPQPCFVCGKKADAHHPDYSRPLDVTWLCPPHHKAAHKIVQDLQRVQLIKVETLAPAARGAGGIGSTGRA